MTEVHCRIIANLGLKFDPNLPRIAVAVHAGASTELFIGQLARGKGSSPGRVEGSSRTMLAIARPLVTLVKLTMLSFNENFNYARSVFYYYYYYYYY